MAKGRRQSDRKQTNLIMIYEEKVLTPITNEEPEAPEGEPETEEKETEEVE